MTSRAEIRGRIVCVSTADWDAPLWTNKQHLMSRLAGAGFDVLYVDSLGLRQPGLGPTDLRRMAKRLRRWKPYASRIEARLWRDTPLVVPAHRYGGVRAVNRRLLSRRLARNIRHLGWGQPILWTYAPGVVDLLDLSSFSRVIYHCVDDLGAFPGIDPVSYAVQERDLAARADVVIASSQPLVKHLQTLRGGPVIYWPNPSDHALFRSVPIRRRASATPPTIGFVGALQEHKINVELLSDVAAARPSWRFECVGPVGEGLAYSSFRTHRFPPNLILCPAVGIQQLPAVLQRFDVGIIPYRLNDYTAGVFPMKVFEYMAAGLPVVSTPLPSLVDEVKHIRFAASADAFVAAIEAALEESCEVRAAGRQYAERFSWESRLQEALEVLK